MDGQLPGGLWIDPESRGCSAGIICSATSGGYGWVGGSRTVDVHVRRLRVKLGEGGPAVRTVHGFGYLLEDDPEVRIGKRAE